MHAAEIVDGKVVRVIVADTLEWCVNNLGGEWVQTSFNTRGGIHTLGGTPINKNFAGPGMNWDGVGFFADQPFDSWTLNQESYLWEAPVAYPTDGGLYSWNEQAQTWDAVPSL